MIDKNLDLIRNMVFFRKNYYNYLNNELKNYDITSSEFSYLKEVVHNDGGLQDSIVKNICIDKAATTRIAQSLEKKSIIKRVKNKDDKRNFNVFLTEEGKKYIDIITNILDNWNKTLCSQSSEEAVEELFNILKVVNNTTDEKTHSK